MSDFGKSILKGIQNYSSYLKKGFDQGRRPGLVGGGILRSLGGWSEVRKLRLKGQDRTKGDERILGDGDFVMDVLSKANERIDSRYKLKSLGYTVKSKEGLYSKSRQKKVCAEARSVFCY